MISLDDATTQLDNLMSSLSKSTREYLISHAIKKWMPLKIGDDDSDTDSVDKKEDILDDPVAMLNAIASEIKTKVPVDAILSSEIMTVPKKGENSDCDPSITTHVDAFLYDDDEVDDLEKEGKLKRFYCCDCNSKNIQPLIFISNSVSRDELYHIFNTLLPTLDGKTILDVGSRLGAVLYGAYVYTDASKIIGVEMNKELCDLQSDIVKKFKMEKRIEIIHKRIEHAKDLVQAADVVILNNVFEFYLPQDEQSYVWEFLKTNIKKGAYIVSRPSITIALSNLNTNIDLNQWVKEVKNNVLDKSQNLFDLDTNNDDEFSEITCYRVL